MSVLHNGRPAGNDARGIGTPTDTAAAPTTLRASPQPADVGYELHDILAELTYPAQRWQIVTVADRYGADSITLGRLHRLPLVDYPSIGHIAHAYTTRAGR